MSVNILYFNGTDLLCILNNKKNKLWHFKRNIEKYYPLNIKEDFKSFDVYEFEINVVAARQTNWTLPGASSIQTYTTIILADGCVKSIRNNDQMGNPIKLKDSYIEDYKVYFPYNEVSDFENYKIHFTSSYDEVYSYSDVFENYLCDGEFLYKLSKNKLFIEKKYKNLVVNEKPFKIFYDVYNFGKMYKIIKNNISLMNVVAHHIESHKKIIYIIRYDEKLKAYNFEIYDFDGNREHKQYIVYNNSNEIKLLFSFDEDENLFLVEILDFKLHKVIDFITFDLNGNIVDGEKSFSRFRKQYDFYKKQLSDD